MAPENAVFEEKATVESWDTDYYHPIAERYYDEAIPTMLRLMAPPPGTKILDAGCGPGLHSARVARAGYRVCAIDFSQTMLQEAQSRVAKAGLASSVELRQEDLTNLTLEDASFQYVFSWGVIIHIREVEKALDGLARVVAPGGKLALYVTNKAAWDHKVESFLRWLLRKPLAGREFHPLGNGFRYEMHDQKLWVWQFDIHELERQLESRGLHLTHRLIGEFSEFQRRIGGPLRRFLLRVNNLCYRLRLPPGIGVTNLLVFEKRGPVNSVESQSRNT